eukprot:279600_1
MRLYEGLEYMMEESHHSFGGKMDALAMFYNQVLATNPAGSLPARSRLINHQLENYIELALSTINEKRQHIVGVIWNFERTFSRHYAKDRVHQIPDYYKRYDRDIFNEIFRYIPAHMHNQCMLRFDRSCLMSIKHQV